MKLRPPPLRLRKSLLPLLGAGMLVAAAGSAAQTPAPGSLSDLRQMSQQWLQSALPKASGTGAGALRMEIVVGELDARLQLAPCAQIEPYMPAGASLWGNARVGLRCMDGRTRWNVFLPVTVRAWGPAWVLRNPVAAGARLSEADVMRAEADWAAQPSPVVQDLEQFVGQTAVVALAAGQPLRQSMLRPSQAFGAGAQVRLQVDGAGFSITTDGFAVGPGYVGQSIRVRTESGRMVGGTVLDARTVRLDL